MILGYAAMHFLVDFVCAWAMLSCFALGPDGYTNILIYNFCAFALQMPLGTVLDSQTNPRIPMIWSVAGAVLTLAGALLHPVLLGLGNALFHVGGGMDVIRDDFAKNRQGAELGVFVAPGAVGLYFGGIAGKTEQGYGAMIMAAALIGLLAVWLFRQKPTANRIQPESHRSQGLPVLLGCCFAVVVLRSWAGLGISFPWKAAYGLPCVLAVAAGKALGGFAAAKYGMAKALTGTLLPAAVCFLLADHPFFGILALLLFNMTMPVTLYLLAGNLPHLSGFSFGVLTFGLFVGFLPVYAGAALPLDGCVFGCLVSIGSLLLLLAGRKAVKRHVLS